MKDFIISLYSNENFPIFLGLFIILLVIAFIVVYFWGRKDQKLVETRKLEKLKVEDAFKETSEKEKAEVREPEESSYEYTRTIELPRLSKDTGVKTVNIDDFEKISDSIGRELDSLEKLTKKKTEEDVDFLYEDTKEMVLPKLKR